MLKRMDRKAFWLKYEKWILPAVLTGFLILLSGLLWDYYYDLNDDVLIKDILSGVYTGVPESRNVQMLYPLSLVLSLLYRVFPHAPVFGIFLCLCQYGSLYLILERSFRLPLSRRGGRLLLVTETLLFTGLYLNHLIFVQYTITAAMLAAAAVCWFMTSDSGREPRAFIGENIPAVLLCFLAFALRSEMMTLLLPFAGVAGICKWGMEEKVFTVGNVRKYLTVFALIVAGMAVGTAADSLAYAGDEWREFRQFFDARTEVYDFQGIPAYEENQALYASLDMNARDVEELLKQYNFGVSDSVDRNQMEALARRGLEKNGYFPIGFSEAVWIYKAHILGTAPYNDMPFSLIEAVLVVLLLFCALWDRRGKIWWQLLLYAGVRSLLWMYIIWRGREVDRIYHSLYLVQILLLGILLLTQWKKKTAVLGSVLLAAAAVSVIPGSFLKVNQEYAAREEANRLNRDVMAYCRSHPENLYLADVYSTVEFSEKMFQDVDNSLGNYDLLGGWLCKSPLSSKKLALFGHSTLEEAVRSGGNVYLLAAGDTSFAWLEDFYGRRGWDIRTARVGEIGTGMGLWQVEAGEEPGDE